MGKPHSSSKETGCGLLAIVGLRIGDGSSLTTDLTNCTNVSSGFDKSELTM